MRTPQEIKNQIKQLERELVQSEDYYSYKKLCSFTDKEEMIGGFNIGNLKKILIELANDKILKGVHDSYDSIEVRMSLQKNRIFVSGNKSINEDNIFNFILLYSSDWYVKNN